MRSWRLLPWLLALSLLLAGCAGARPAAEGGPAEALPPADAPAAPAPEAPALTAAQTEARARSLTEVEVLTAYDQAVTAFGWFQRTPLPSTEETRTVGDRIYRRVDARGIETAEDLRTYLRSLFSQEVTERLMATGGEDPMYREIDGALYVSGTDGRKDPRKGAVETQVEQTGETGYVVNVTVELLDDDLVTATGVECWSFPYAFVGDRWVFTDFHLVD